MEDVRIIEMDSKFLSYKNIIINTLNRYSYPLDIYQLWALSQLIHEISIKQFVNLLHDLKIHHNIDHLWWNNPENPDNIKDLTYSKMYPTSKRVIKIKY